MFFDYFKRPGKFGYLGKQPAKIDSRTLKLARYFGPTLPILSSVDWTAGITKFGMMRNDTLGDCVLANCGHAVQTWTADTTFERTLPDWIIEFYYGTWAGYVAGDPSTDNGAVIIDVLNNWRKYGFGARYNGQGSEKLVAYADPDPNNVTHIKQSIALFGGVSIGLNLPITAQTQVGKIWDVVGDGRTGDSAPGSWGGHCVWTPAYYDDKYLVCITWGAKQKMTWNFWRTYCDEAHALLSTDFIRTNGIAPSDFNLKQLEVDLQLVTG